MNVIGECQGSYVELTFVGGNKNEREKNLGVLENFDFLVCTYYPYS